MSFKSGSNLISAILRKPLRTVLRLNTVLLTALLLPALLAGQPAKASSPPHRLAAEETFKINAGLNDAWVNPEAAFQGMFLTVFPLQKLLFAAWFTFDSEEPPAEATATVGAPDQRWITALGAYDGNTASLQAELTTGEQ